MEAGDRDEEGGTHGDPLPGVPGPESESRKGQGHPKEPLAQDPLMGRVALHAWKLKFKHPTTGEMMEFTAPPPDDLEYLIDNLRKYRKFGSKTTSR